VSIGRFKTMLQDLRMDRVHVQFCPSPVADLRRLVSGGLLDIAFVLEEPLHSTKLIVKPLCPEPLHVIAAPSHPFAQVDRIEPADMERETVLLTESGCSYRALSATSVAFLHTDHMAPFLPIQGTGKSPPKW